jgi:sulfur-oxidizing protein SoxX
MRKTVLIMITGGTAALLGLGTLLIAPVAQAAGQAPSSDVCDNKASPPKDIVTQGGCLVIERKKGNCNACHAIAGTTAGNIAPPLVSIKARFPDKAKLREQIWDASKANPQTIMPPFGRHQILSPDEIDKVVEFIWTL